ncbi:MAG: hypothetical protein RI885_1597, partial [Actinomycetota bacterium]
MRRGTNLRALGGFNQTVILDAIRRSRSGVSRVELAQLTGLSAQTVTNVSRRLIDAGTVREAGQQNSGVGKPRVMLELEPTAGYAVGVHIDPAVITYVILDLTGGMVAQTSIHSSSATAADQVVSSMAQAIGSLAASSGVDVDRILGVGIAAPGPLDSNSGLVLEPPLLEGWHRVALRGALAEETGHPVLLEKDVAAATVAELWTSEGEDRDDFLFFYYGTGVGSGIALDHEVIRGSTGNAGEIGHILVPSP